MATQYVGKVTTLAKVWADVNGRQVDELKPGTQVKGYKVENGYFWLVSPVSGFTKTQWLNVVEVEVTPPPPPPPTDDFPAEIGITIDGITKIYVPR